MAIKHLPHTLFCILILHITFFAQIKSFSFDELTGTYLTGTTFVGSRIQITADGNYQEFTYTEFEVFSESGKYYFDSGVLKFKVLKSTRKYINSEKEINQLDPNQNKDVAKESRSHVYLPIRWRTRIYLIPKNEMLEFINAVNLSVEPRDNTDSKIYLGNFYLRDISQKNLDFHDSIFLAKGLPELPEEWSSFLLKRPVTAKIIKIEAKKKIAIIDKGSNNGLKIGMRLIANNSEPSLWSGAEILSVEPKTAKVKVLDELKVSDQLNSKYIHSNLLPYLN